MSQVTRSRRFFLQWLLVGGGSVVALAACGDSDSSLTALSPTPEDPEAVALLSEEEEFSEEEGLSGGIQISFPQGVFSGDPSATGVVVATRALPVDESPEQISVVLEVANTRLFLLPQRIELQGRAVAGANYRQEPGDYIVRYELTDLRSDQEYFFRFRSGRSRSPVGRFRTLPDANDGRPVRFLHLSCANEPPYPIAPALANSIRSFDPYLVVFNGDTVYADRFWLGQEPVPSLEFYRSLYRDQRDPAYTGAGFDELYQQVPFVANWDDHEVIDDYSGQGDGKPAVQLEVGGERDVTFLQTLGYQAFFEYSCVRAEFEDRVRGVDSLTRLFRTTQLGANAELITLDLRQYRDTQGGTFGGFAPLVPVLPEGITPHELIERFDIPEILKIPFFGTRGPLFQSNLRRQRRQLLGRPQKRWLFDRLQSSTATFKIIVSEFIFSENFALAYDRWEGYWRERQEVLEVLESVPNVVIITGDQHAGQISQINAGSSNPIYEIGTGPTGQSTLSRSVEDIGASLGVTGASQLYYDIINFLISEPQFGGDPENSLQTLKFYEIDTPNYMTIEATSGTLSLQIRDSSGGVVVDPLGRRGEILIPAQ